MEGEGRETHTLSSQVELPMRTGTHLEGAVVDVPPRPTPHAVAVAKAVPVLAHEARAVPLRLNHETLGEARPKCGVNPRAIRLEHTHAHSHSKLRASNTSRLHTLTPAPGCPCHAACQTSTVPGTPTRPRTAGGRSRAWRLVEGGEGNNEREHKHAHTKTHDPHTHTPF